MALFKVLGFAAVTGLFFAVLIYTLLLEPIERISRGNAPTVQLSLICVGILLGAIAGAAQVVTDALEKRQQ